VHDLHGTVSVFPLGIRFGFGVAILDFNMTASAWVSIPLTVVSAIVCSLPYILGYHYDDSDRQSLERSINSDDHLDSLLISIVACLVISFDGLLDHLFGSLLMAKTSTYRWLLLLSLIVPNAFMFFAYKTNVPHHMSPELFSTMNNVREILLQCSLINFFISSSPTRAKVFACGLVTQFALVLGIILFQYGNFMALPMFLLYIACVSATTSLVLVLWMLYSQFIRLVKTSDQREDGDVESMIYILSLGFNIFGKYVVYALTYAIIDMSLGYQSSIFNCIDIVTMMIIVSVHGRKSREETLLFQVSDLSLFPSHSLSLSLCLSLSLPISLSVCLSPSVSVPLFLCL
jgi:hypothetical protein